MPDQSLCGRSVLWPPGKLLAYSVFMSNRRLGLELHEQYVFKSAHHLISVRRYGHVLEFYEWRLSRQSTYSNCMRRRPGLLEFHNQYLSSISTHTKSDSHTCYGRRVWRSRVVLELYKQHLLGYLSSSAVPRMCPTARRLWPLPSGLPAGHRDLLL